VTTISLGGNINAESMALFNVHQQGKGRIPPVSLLSCGLQLLKSVLFSVNIALVSFLTACRTEDVSNIRN